MSTWEGAKVGGGGGGRGGGRGRVVLRQFAGGEGEGEAADLGGSSWVEPVLDDGPQPDHKVGRVDDEAATHELGIVEVELVGLGKGLGIGLELGLR